MLYIAALLRASLATNAILSTCIRQENPFVDGSDGLSKTLPKVFNSRMQLKPSNLFMTGLLFALQLLD